MAAGFTSKEESDKIEKIILISVFVFLLVQAYKNIVHLSINSQKKKIKNIKRYKITYLQKFLNVL